MNIKSTLNIKTALQWYLWKNKKVENVVNETLAEFAHNEQIEGLFDNFKSCTGSKPTYHDDPALLPRAFYHTNGAIGRCYHKFVYMKFTISRTAISNTDARARLICSLEQEISQRLGTLFNVDICYDRNIRNYIGTIALKNCLM